MQRSKRVALSLKPDIDLIISDLAKLTNQTKTTVINSILLDMRPSLSQAVKLLKKAQEGKQKEAFDVAENLLSDSSSQINEAQLELTGLGESYGYK